MSDSSDPTYHRDAEKQFISHVRALLQDDRFTVDTKRGRHPVASLFPTVSEGEDGVARGEKLKRMMLELGVADRSMQGKMPIGERVEVTLKKQSFWMFKKVVGELVVTCVSPARAILKGQAGKPLDAADVNAFLAQLKQSAGGPDIPTTVVLMSTSGFTPDARALASDTSKRTLLTVEPNESGGWTVAGPAQAAQLVDLLDPEEEQSKRHRVRDFVDANKFDMMNGGIVSEKIAARTQLPLQIVEAELKSYAEQSPGLAAKRIDGRFMLFREGSMFSTDPGGSNMPFWEKVSGVFKRNESTDKKIARLSTERASLTVQREHAYDEIATVEKKETELAKSFKESTALAQRRIATEISQLRKDIERRQQILGAIDKKINIINTGIHTLELQNQLSPEKLKSLENIAEGAEEVETGMAELQQLDEEANSLSGVGASAVPDDVQAILDELKGKTETAPEPARTVKAQKTTDRPAVETATPDTQRRRNEPEGA